MTTETKYKIKLETDRTHAGALVVEVEDGGSKKDNITVYVQSATDIMLVTPEELVSIGKSLIDFGEKFK